MNDAIASFEHRKIRDHRIPVVLGEGLGIVLTVLRKKTPLDHQSQSLASALRCGCFDHRIVRHLGQHCFQFGLCVAQLRIEFDALHHNRIALAVIKPG